MRGAVAPGALTAAARRSSSPSRSRSLARSPPPPPVRRVRIGSANKRMPPAYVGQEGIVCSMGHNGWVQARARGWLGGALAARTPPAPA